MLTSDFKWRGRGDFLFSEKLRALSTDSPVPDKCENFAFVQRSARIGDFFYLSVGRK